MKRSQDRILTTHVGSLIRPKELLDLGLAAKEDASRRPAYETALTRDVANVVRMQAETGIDIVNDGEYGKSSWAAYILERITGFEIRPDERRPVVWLGSDRVRFAELLEKDIPRVKNGTPTEACVGPITYRVR